MIAVDHTYVWDTREREAEQKRVGWVIIFQKETYLFPIYVIKVILCKLLLHNLPQLDIDSVKISTHLNFSRDVRRKEV